MPELNWIQMLFILGIPAAFGGALKGVYDQIGSNNPSKIDWAAGFFAPILGVGGVAATSLVLLWADIITLEGTDRNILILISFGVVSGFIGDRILPFVGRGLERRIAAIEGAEGERAEKVSEIEHKVDYSTAISEVNAPWVPSQAEELLPQLIAMANEKPEARRLNLALGHLYKRVGRFQEAEDRMSKYLEVMRRQGGQVSDIAAATYNRACYRVLRAAHAATSGEEDSMLVDLAMDDLQEAIRLDKGVIADAPSDPDFDHVRENPRFRDLVPPESD